MTGAKRFSFSTALVVIVYAGAFLFLLALLLSPAHAVTIFQEDWNSYTGFPATSNDLGGHRTNYGVPTIAEGADNDWLAGRIEFGDAAVGPAAVAGDVGVLAVASGSPFDTPAGRIDDDAGLVAQIDLTNFTGVTLAFDWRTFNTGTTDRLVVAYYIGSDLGSPGSAYDWFNDPAFGNADMTGADPQGQANPWYLSNWTEVFRDTSPGSFMQEPSIDLSGANGQQIYLAFWLDNGDHDLGKIDNIVVSGNVIPEPCSLVLLLTGACLLARQRRRA